MIDQTITDQEMKTKIMDVFAEYCSGNSPELALEQLSDAELMYLLRMISDLLISRMQEEYDSRARTILAEYN